MLGRSLNGNQLKLIAVLSMIIDHVGLVLFGGMLMDMVPGSSSWDIWFPVYTIFRSIGRMAFPIFCFFLVEGFLHTRDWKKYAMRLGLFAIISEPALDLMVFGTWWDLGLQNIYFTLFTGLLMMAALHRVEEQGAENLRFLLQCLVLLAACGLAWILKMDYSYEGILLIGIYYMCRFDRKKQLLAGGLWHLLNAGGLLSMVGVAAGCSLLFLYDGSRGSRRYQFLFYWFYPIHMVVLGLLGVWLFAS